MMDFSDVLEEIDKLPLDEQELLADIVRKRIAEQRRERIAQDIREAQREYQAGKTTPATPDELMSDILS